MDFVTDELGERIYQGDFIVVEGDVYQVVNITVPKITDPTLKNPIDATIAMVRIIRDLTMAFDAGKKIKNVYKVAYSPKTRKPPVDPS